MSYGEAISLIPADIVLVRPGSKIGESVPGSLGPPGKMPTHSSAPASKPRYQDSPSEASETPGASGFGTPKSTRRSSIASATAATARPPPIAKRPIGGVLKEPKNVISSAGKRAGSGTPATATPPSSKSTAKTAI